MAASGASTGKQGTVLVVADDAAAAVSLRLGLEQLGTCPEVLHVAEQQALATLEDRPVDLVVSAQRDRACALRLLREVARYFPDPPRVWLGGRGPGGDAAAPVEELAIVVAAEPDGEEAHRVLRLALGGDGVDPEAQALLVHTKVSPAQLDRAERIRQHMQNPSPLGEVLIELGQLSRADYDRARNLRRSRLSLIELLVEDGRLRPEDRARYEESRRRSPGASDRELLVDANLVTEEHYLRALCIKLAVPYSEPDVGAIDPHVLRKASFQWLLRVAALPVRRHAGNVEVIVSDPGDRRLLGELQQIFGEPVSTSYCARERILETLRTFQRIDAGRTGDGATALSLQYREIDAPDDGNEIGEEAVQIVDYLLLRAIELGASDLHIEPLQAKVRVRVRIDGILQHLTDLPADMAPRVISRIKIVAGADIAEKRRHQDGKICVRLASREIDIRMSSYVSMYGETIVMRLLDRERGILPLEDCGFTESGLAALSEVALKTSSGLMLVVGPTGSGKTTALYSFIDHANDPTEKVITCEDPVEYVIEGIVQCSVNEKTGPTFAESLRSIVRQDPDRIVVGEIRDRVTASLALEAALTGHKVLATFHTEEAVGAFVRLLEMGVEPYLVASTVSAVVAQRLLRRVCTECRRPGSPTRAEARFLSLDAAQIHAMQLFRAGECGHCKGTGYRGRTAVHEILIPDEAFREAVLRRASSEELRRCARRLPEFLTMQEDALLKAATGEITLSEIIDNAPRDATPRPIATLKNIAALRRI